MISFYGILCELKYRMAIKMSYNAFQGTGIVTVFFALVLTVAGLILAIRTGMHYKRAKDEQGEDFSMKPYAIKIVICFVLFIIAQILLAVNKHHIY